MTDDTPIPPGEDRTPKVDFRGAAASLHDRKRHCLLTRKLAAEHPALFAERAHLLLDLAGLGAIEIYAGEITALASLLATGADFRLSRRPHGSGTLLALELESPADGTVYADGATLLETIEKADRIRRKREAMRKGGGT